MPYLSQSLSQIIKIIKTNNNNLAWVNNTYGPTFFVEMYPAIA